MIFCQFVLFFGQYRVNHRGHLSNSYTSIFTGRTEGSEIQIVTLMEGTLKLLKVKIRRKCFHSPSKNISFVK